MDVWSMALRRDGPSLAPLDGLLTDDERARRAALRSWVDAELFVAAHALARWALVRRLGGAPAHWRVQARPGQAPAIECAQGGAPVALSWSHSGVPRCAAPDAPATGQIGTAGVALLWGTDGRVGLDLEHVDPSLGVDELAWAWHPTERAACSARRSTRPALAALRAWTVKEALAKAQGTGLSTDFARWPLRRSGAAQRRLQLAQPSASEPRWLLERRRLPGAVEAAVAARLDTRDGHAAAPAAFVWHRITPRELLGLARATVHQSR